MESDLGENVFHLRNNSVGVSSFWEHELKNDSGRFALAENHHYVHAHWS